MVARRGGVVAIVLAAAALASPAQAYIALNSFVVERISPEQMLVRPRSGLNAIDGWCAVGDYVITMLNLPPDTLIWRISEPPRRRGDGIVFSLSAEGAASTSGLNKLGDAPVYVTAGAARAYCRESIMFWELR